MNTDCLLFDNTNFFTYIDTKTDSKLARRGNSKEKRKDLKIIGLSMMVSPDLMCRFYEVYPGNRNDSKQFSNVLGKLKKRYQDLCGKEHTITLVFDKGNNSPENYKNN